MRVFDRFRRLRIGAIFVAGVAISTGALLASGRAASTPAADTPVQRALAELSCADGEMLGGQIIEYGKQGPGGARTGADASAQYVDERLPEQASRAGAEFAESDHSGAAGFERYRYRTDDDRIVLSVFVVEATEHSDSWAVMGHVGCEAGAQSHRR
jgi:hypothetical protein